MSDDHAQGVAPERILVVIPALDEAGHIAGCIGSLIGDDPAMARVSVVVADGGSSDGTRAIVERLVQRWPMLRLIDNPARLQSAGINRAVALCAGPGHDILVRCDAHALYSPGYVRAVADSLERHGAAALATVMDATGETGFARAAAWIVDTPLGCGGSAHRGGRRSGPVDHGHHAGFRLDWFRRVGGYDPDFSHNEDAEFDHRLTRAGGLIWLDAGIRLGYVMRPSLAALARQYRAYGRGRARTLRKHRTRPRLRQMLPVACLLGLVVSAALAPLAPVLWLVPLGYGALLAAAALCCAFALRSEQGLWAGPALAAMHLCWALGFLEGLGGSVAAGPVVAKAEG